MTIHFPIRSERRNRLSPRAVVIASTLVPVVFYLYVVMFLHGWGILAFSSLPGILAMIFWRGIRAGVRAAGRLRTVGCDLSDTDIAIDDGIRRVEVPLTEVLGFSPVAVSRDGGNVGELHQIYFSEAVKDRAGMNLWLDDPEYFLQELAVRCPHLEREGPRLNAKS